jgi:rhodanese-related sulfurtransferase
MNELWNNAEETRSGYREIDPTTLAGNEADVHIIDVREVSEYTGPLGHIEGSELVPLGELSEHIDQWDPAETVVVVCRSGGRSGKAAQMLAAEGFSQVINLRGGMMAHNQNQLPVAR